MRLCDQHAHSTSLLAGALVEVLGLAASQEPDLYRKAMDGEWVDWFWVWGWTSARFTAAAKR